MIIRYISWISDDIVMSIDTSDWMSKLDDDIKISQINIPGTHDTCARYGGPLVECQSLELIKQLEAGIRFIDIRCRHKKNEFAIYHGIVPQQIFFDTVRDVCQEFIRSHPRECIIMSIKEENKAEKCTRKFEETLNEYLIDNEHYWYLGDQVPTLGDVRGRIILLRRFSASTMPKGIDVSFWQDNATFDGTRNGVTIYVQDKYKVPSALDVDMKNKWKAIEDALSHANGRTPEHMTEIVLNFASGASALAHPCTVAVYMNQKIKDYLSNANNVCRSGYGIIPMDFPQKDLVQEIIKINYSPSDPTNIT